MFCFMSLAAAAAQNNQVHRLEGRRLEMHEHWLCLLVYKSEHTPFYFGLFALCRTVLKECGFFVNKKQAIAFYNVL
jgi:hypothetical protein